ncbi:hypothetical protein FBQ97_15820 [Acidobacteria bacterium ACD]|nr:hypothetical protein [Acidobacteria bacterium ACD]
MRRTLASLALLPLALALRVEAQFESPLLSKVQPNLVNPGGKSLAMGGAFVSLADDATAAFANPAGLPQLSSWQLGASGKGFTFRPALSPANYLETSPGSWALQSYDSYQPTGGAQELEYAALVVPLLGNLTLALYQAVNLRFSISADDLLGGSYRAFSMNRTAGSAGTIDEAGGLEIRNRVWGASAGLRLGRFSLGAGVTLNQLSYDFTGPADGGAHLFVTNDPNGNRVDPLYPRVETRVTASTESGARVGWVVGARVELYEAARLSVGAAYRRSPSYDVGYSVSATRTYDARKIAEFSCGVDDPSIPGSGASACGRFKVPDDWAVGVSGMPLANLLLSAELQRVAYSDFDEGFVPLYVYCRVPSPAGCAAADRTVALGSAEDGWLPRVGAEWTFSVGSSADLSLRAGYYREPAHGMTLELYPDVDRDRRADAGPPVEVSDPPFSDAFRTSFDGGEPDDHLSMGAGATLWRKLSIDIAVDVGRASKQVVLSAFLRL